MWVISIMCNMFLLLVILNSVLIVSCSKDVTLVRDVRNDRESSENDLRIDKIMQELQDIDVYKDVVKLNIQLGKEIKWIIQGICSPPISKYKDCTELKKKTKKKLNDGVYTVYPGGDNPVEAYCDITTDGGGWTVMLKRHGGSVSFKCTWVQCENGFGDFHGEFWFGNKYTHMLTSSGKYELRVDMVDKNSNKIYAVYRTFIIGDAASKYKLTVSDYSGNAVDELKHHNGMKFTTIDQDNDIYSNNCAILHTGSWWYNRCIDCDLSRTDKKPFWYGAVSNPVMMIRKV